MIGIGWALTSTKSSDAEGRAGVSSLKNCLNL
jgi:hypothetical protein